LYCFNGEDELVDAAVGTLDLAAGATPKLDWTTAGGLGLLALDFFTLAIFRLTFLGLSLEEGDLPQDLLGASVAGLNSKAFAMTFFSLYSMGTLPP